MEDKLQQAKKTPWIREKVLFTGALFVAGVMVLNENVRRFGQFVTPGGVGTAVRFLLYAAVLYLMLVWVKNSSSQTEVITRGRFFCTQTRVALLFFLVYLIGLLIYYPGVMYWDTMRQIIDFFDGFTTAPYCGAPHYEVSAFLNDHDGAVDTVLFGTFISIGNLFHDPKIGMFLFCLIQIALFACLFAKIVCTIREAGAPKWLRVAAFAFFMHPFVCYYAMMMLKDVTFALCFLPYFMVYDRLAGSIFSYGDGTEQAGARDGKNNRKDAVLLVVLSLLCALTKKPGVYIVAISNLVLLAASLPGRLRAIRNGPRTPQAVSPLPLALSVLLPSFIVLWLFPQVVFPAFQVFPGGREEMLAPCLHSTVLTVVEKEDTLTEEDKQIINSVMHYDELVADYGSDTMHGAKNQFRLFCSGEDLANYLKYWFRTGLRHPAIYVRSVMGVNGGFFSPTETLEIYISANPYPPELNYPGLHNLAATLTLREDVERMYDILSETPPFSFFFQNVLYTWIIPAGAALILLARGKRRELSGLVPVLLSILVLVAGPETVTRFGVHLILLSPYLCWMACRK